MAKILFRPICSKCRKELRCVIDYGVHDIQIEDARMYRPNCIDPECCPYCGEQFDCIEMPTSIPFDNTYTKFIRHGE